MGESRPAVDVARRLAAAIAAMGAVLATLVVCVGGAVAAPTATTGFSSTRAATAPEPLTLGSARDLLVVGAPGSRSEDDLDAGWTGPQTAADLLPAPAGFFVGRTDTSVAGPVHADVARAAVRGPPRATVLAPR